MYISVLMSGKSLPGDLSYNLNYVLNYNLTYRPQATGHRPKATGQRPQAKGHRPQATGHRPQIKLRTKNKLRNTYPSFQASIARTCHKCMAWGVKGVEDGHKTSTLQVGHP
jgi:hypothetical protein